MNRTIFAKVLRRKKKEKKGKKGQKKGKKTSNSIEIQAPLFRKNQSRSNCFQFNEVILETIRRLRFFRKRGALNREKTQNPGFIRSRIRPPFFPFFYRFFPVFTSRKTKKHPIGPKISAFERNAKAINLLKSQLNPTSFARVIGFLLTFVFLIPLPHSICPFHLIRVRSLVEISRRFMPF